MRSTVGDAQAAAVSASKAAEKASEVALAISRRSGLQQGAFVEILDQGFQKVLQKKHQYQSTSVSQAPAPRWQLAMAALVGFLAFGLGNFAACGFSLSWVNDAAVGREFLNVLPSLDPELKNQLLAVLEKRQQRD
jgi:hypothetical protein